MQANFAVQKELVSVQTNRSWAASPKIMHSKKIICMNPLTYIVVLLSLICLPAVLITAVWLFIFKRGWGSKWLVSFLIAFGLSSIVVVMWLGTQDNSILFMGLGMSVLSGIGFYGYLRTSPKHISEALTGQNQNIKNTRASLSNDEKQKQSSHRR